MALPSTPVSSEGVDRLLPPPLEGVVDSWPVRVIITVSGFPVWEENEIIFFQMM